MLEPWETSFSAFFFFFDKSSFSPAYVANERRRWKGSIECCFCKQPLCYEQENFSCVQLTELLFVLFTACWLNLLDDDVLVALSQLEFIPKQQKYLLTNFPCHFSTLAMRRLMTVIKTSSTSQKRLPITSSSALPTSLLLDWRTVVPTCIIITSPTWVSISSENTYRSETNFAQL